MAEVEAVCISAKKGMVKKAQAGIDLKESWGIEGDAHAGDWHRQVSLLAGESIDQVKEILPKLQQGAFAENIITRGIDLASIGIGNSLQIGSTVVITITQIGKECHNSSCAIKKATGDCIMPREGIFAKVVVGGRIVPGDKIVIL